MFTEGRSTASRRGEYGGCHTQLITNHQWPSLLAATHPSWPRASQMTKTHNGQRANICIVAFPFLSRNVFVKTLISNSSFHEQIKPGHRLNNIYLHSHIGGFEFYDVSSYSSSSSFLYRLFLHAECIFFIFPVPSSLPI